MSSPAARIVTVVLALACGAGAAALALASDHQEPRAVWAVLGPVVGWSFIFTGLYARRQRPESRTGTLMVVLGFAWFVVLLDAANSSLLYTVGLVVGGLFGSVFLHLGLAFPSGRLAPGLDRALVAAGYVIFPLARVPALFVAGPQELGCDGCPANVLLVERDPGLARVLLAVGAAVLAALFVMVLVRAVQRWRRAGPFERLQLTPVYVTSLLTFLLVTVARSGVGDAASWAAIVAAGLTPFAFLGGLLRTHVSLLHAELAARLEELRASRARIVEAGDAARRRLERDLHDGAQSRLVGLALLLRTARKRAEGDPELAALLDRSIDELQTSLAELRELAQGIHPVVLSERGLEPALHSLASRAPIPVTLHGHGDERLPGPVESAAYFVVSEALANVAKYSRASQATVAVRRVNGSVSVDVTDDGVGGADPADGSGLRGLADRIAALDGTLELESPAGRGTRVHAEIPLAPTGS